MLFLKHLVQNTVEKYLKFNKSKEHFDLFIIKLTQKNDTPLLTLHFEKLIIY